MTKNGLISLRTLLDLNETLSADDLICAREFQGIPVIAQPNEETTALGVDKLGALILANLSEEQLDELAKSIDKRTSNRTTEVDSYFATTKLNPAKRLLNEACYLYVEKDKKRARTTSIKALAPPLINKIAFHYNSNLAHDRTVIGSMIKSEMHGGKCCEKSCEKHNVYEKDQHLTHTALKRAISSLQKYKTIRMKNEIYYLINDETLSELFIKESTEVLSSPKLFRASSGNMEEYDPLEPHRKQKIMSECTDTRGFDFGSLLKGSTQETPKPIIYFFVETALDRENLDSLRSAYKETDWKTILGECDIDAQKEINEKFKSIQKKLKVTLENTYLKISDAEKLGLNHTKLRRSDYIKEHYSEKLNFALDVYFEFIVDSKEKQDGKEYSFSKHDLRKRLSEGKKSENCQNTVSIKGDFRNFVADIITNEVLNKSYRFYITKKDRQRLPHFFKTILNLSDHLYSDLKWQKNKATAAYYKEERSKAIRILGLADRDFTENISIRNEKLNQILTLIRPFEKKGRPKS